MSEHTPGPWQTESELPYARKPRVHAKDWTLIAEVGNAQNERQDIWEADARLIAAAPDLADALGKALVAMRFAKAFVSDEYDLDPAMHIAIDALAKAGIIPEPPRHG